MRTVNNKKRGGVMQVSQPKRQMTAAAAAAASLDAALDGEYGSPIGSSPDRGSGGVALLVSTLRSQQQQQQHKRGTHEPAAERGPRTLAVQRQQTNARDTAVRALRELQRHVHTVCVPRGTRLCAPADSMLFLIDALSADDAAREFGESVPLLTYECTRDLRVLDMRGSSYSVERDSTLSSTRHWSRSQNALLTNLDAARVGHGGMLCAHILHSDIVVHASLPPLSVLPCALELAARYRASRECITNELQLLQQIAISEGHVDAVLTLGHGALNCTLMMLNTRTSDGALRRCSPQETSFCETAPELRPLSQLYANTWELAHRVSRLIDSFVLVESAEQSPAPDELEQDDLMETIYAVLATPPPADAEAERQWERYDLYYCAVAEAARQQLACNAEDAAADALDDDLLANGNAGDESARSENLSVAERAERFLQRFQPPAMPTARQQQQQSRNIIGQWLRDSHDF